MNIENTPIIKNSFYTRYGKRILDIVISLAVIVMFLPLYLGISCLVFFCHGRPILYHSIRPGKDEKLFQIYKFRSMTNQTGSDGKLLPDVQRTTKFGKFIRRTSLDEIPEFFNVLKGDMSIIGPRPLLVEYLPLYSERYRRRHCVRPGLICARLHDDGSPWTWGAQFETDIYYIENMSLALDIRMIAGLFKELIKGSEVRTNGTREPFNGRNLW